MTQHQRVRNCELNGLSGNCDGLPVDEEENRRVNPVARGVISSVVISADSD